MKPTAAQPRKLPDVVFFQEGPGLRNWQWTDDGMKVINGTNILPDGSVDISNTDKFIAQAEFEGRYRRFAIDEGDIVLSSSGTLGKVGRINADHLPLMMNTSVIRFRTKDPSIVDDGYLFAFLRSPQFQALIRTFAVGGVQQNFGPVHLKQIEMPVPPLHQQRCIADILSAYDDLIENNRRRMVLLEDAARQLYQEWFVRLRFPGHEHTRITDGIPEGWNQGTIGDYVGKGVVDLQTGPFGTQLRASDYTDTGIPVINVRNIGYGDLRADKLEHVPDLVVERLDVHILRSSDIVFGRKGAVDRHVLVGPAQHGWMQGSDCIRLRALTDAVCPLFLSFGFREEHHKEWMLTQCSNKATMASLNQEVIARIPVRVPNARLMREFRDFASESLRQCDILQRQSQKAAEARDLLLPRLMSGEIAV
jgi:type I restriction enzyme S subunit